jgi:crotonobetainyl-CoA:carnitine CoA-transferase CaiB-like acyl-CoA transferase
MRDVAGASIAQLTNPIRLAATPAQYTLPPPSIGADSDAVLQWLAEPRNMP